MKRLTAFLIMLISAAVFCLRPAEFVMASSASDSQIYQKSSTGAMVVRIQTRLRELGYLNFKPTGSYKSMTVDAVKSFQSNYRNSGYEMQVDGRIGEQSLELLFKYDSLRSSLSGISIPSGPKHGSSTLVKTGELVPWDTVKDLLKSKNEYVCTDCYTGIKFKLRYFGGENHAEMESTDYGYFFSICGSELNFLKRPIVIEIGGRNIAASVQCWPHGEDFIKQNAMHGHVCVYFDGCLSHVGNLPDVEHNEVVRKAAGL